MENEIITQTSYTKRPLWQRGLIYGLIAAVAYGSVYYLFMRNRGGYQTRPVADLTQKQLFKDSSVFGYAYKIFPGLLSDQAKQAMVGFVTQTRTIGDGSVQVTMTATNPEYKDQQYVVKPGYSLYFIEKNPGDDSVSENADRFLTDDTAALVDAQGYLVN